MTSGFSIAQNFLLTDYERRSIIIVGPRVGADGDRAPRSSGDWRCEMKRELIKIDKNGTKWFDTFCKCDRCDGTGVYTWGGTLNGRPLYAGTCFKCNGAKFIPTIEKEYTPEYRAKLDAANEKRKAKLRAKWEAERAEREAEMVKRAEERARREAERLAEIERNRGNFIGEIGERLNVEVTLDRTFSYEVPRYGAPWEIDTVTGYVFKTSDNNTIVWKTTGTLTKGKAYCPTGHFSDKKGWFDWVLPEIGDRMVIKGTIKAHEEYDNVNQTILTRVTVV